MKDQIQNSEKLLKSTSNGGKISWPSLISYHVVGQGGTKTSLTMFIRCVCKIQILTLVPTSHLMEIYDPSNVFPEILLRYGLSFQAKHP